MFIFLYIQCCQSRLTKNDDSNPTHPPDHQSFQCIFFYHFLAAQYIYVTLFCSSVFYCMLIDCKVLSLRQKFPPIFNYLSAYFDWDQACFLDICIKHMGKEEKDWKMEHIARATFVQNCILLSGLVLNKFSSLSCPVKASKLVNYNCNAGYKKFWTPPLESLQVRQGQERWCNKASTFEACQVSYLSLRWKVKLDFIIPNFLHQEIILSH